MAMSQVGSVATQVKRIAIVTDSRGVGLQEELDSINEHAFDIKVFVKKGNGIAQAVRETSKSLIWMAPDLVLVLAGICDITQLNRAEWTVSLPEESVARIVDCFQGSMDATRHHLSIFLTERPHSVIFSQIVGMDMAKFNRMDEKHPQQALLDEMVTHVNHAIAEFNKENNMLTPWLGQDVHHNKKGGRKTTRYYKLAPDGLHLTDQLREKWAATLYSVIVKTKQELCKVKT